MTTLDGLYVLLGIIGAVGIGMMIPQSLIDAFTPDSVADSVAKYYYNLQDQHDAEKYGEDSVIRDQFRVK